MSENKNNASDVVKKKSRTRKLHTIDTKMDIIRRAENGESLTAIGRMYELSSSTISSIIKNKNKIKNYVQNCGNVASTIITKKHGKVMDEMERCLYLWIEDQHQKGISLKLSVIQAKARSLHEELKIQLKEESAAEFKASKGWFENFKMRTLCNTKFIGEAVIADQEAELFYKFVEEEGYSPYQIFTVYQTGLFWKKMPPNTYIAKEELFTPGPKSSKNKITLMLCGNLAGDFKLKPLLIYQANNPRALKSKDKEALPVIWKSNAKTVITSQIFKEWFTNNFVSSVRQYCDANNLPFKVLLLLNIAPEHPQILQNLYPEITVVFFPRYVLNEIQPLNDTVISIFKLYYITAILNQAIGAIKINKVPTLRDFWKNYNIYDAMNIISDSWIEMKESTIKGCWKKVFPQMINDFTDFEENLETIINEIVNIMNQLNLNINYNDIIELINSNPEVESNEDVINEKETTLINEDAETKPTNVKKRKVITVRKMKEAFAHLDKFLSIIEGCDPKEDRVARVRRSIEKHTACYRKVYQEKRKKKIEIQLNINEVLVEMHET